MAENEIMTHRVELLGVSSSRITDGTEADDQRVWPRSAPIYHRAASQ